MNVEDRKKWGKVLEKWTPFFIIACTLVGVVLGSILIYIFQGEFSYEVLVGGIVAAVILVGIEIIKRIRKKDKLPEVDERVSRNLFHFSAYASHITLAILFISLAFLTILGNESISIIYFWIFFFAYIWVVGIGVIIIKRR